MDYMPFVADISSMWSDIIWVLFTLDSPEYLKEGMASSEHQIKFYWITEDTNKCDV